MLQQQKQQQPEEKKGFTNPEIMAIESDRQDASTWNVIRLLRDGDYWHANEWSGWLMGVVVHNEMKRRYQEEGLESLCEDLRRLDPEHYEVVDRQNHRRVIHALEICYQTGKTYTSFRTQARKPRPFTIIKIGLNRDRDELYQRINLRVDDMMQQGLLEEAQSMLPYRDVNALNTVGYKELFDYFDGRWPLTEAVSRIKGNTRRYARKQLTWYKRDEQVRWFHPDQQQEILNFISHYE